MRDSKNLSRALVASGMICIIAALAIATISPTALATCTTPNCLDDQAGPTQQDHYCDYQPCEPDMHDCYCEGGTGQGGQVFGCAYVWLANNGPPPGYALFDFVSCTPDEGATCTRSYRDCGLKTACDPNCSDPDRTCTVQQNCCCTLYTHCEG